MWWKIEYMLEMKNNQDSSRTLVLMFLSDIERSFSIAVWQADAPEYTFIILIFLVIRLF